MKTSVRPRLIVFGILFWISAYSLAQAATYYVAPTGNNTNPGTITQPFATLQKAHDVANPGDTIYMRGGTYTLVAPEGYIDINRSGSSGNLIKLFNYPGEVPVIDGINLTGGGNPNFYVTASWWHFKGLEIKNAYAAAIQIAGSSNHIIELCNVHHNNRVQTSGSAIAVEHPGANNLILNNDGHHNGQPTAANGGSAIGVNSQATGNVVRGNRAWRNNDNGIELWDGANVLVENNWVWETGYTDALTATNGDGVGFKLGGAGAGDGNHIIRNNLAWNNRSNQFDANSADNAMDVYNNTAWNAGAASSNYHFWVGTVAFVLKNNLAMSPGGISMGPSTQATFNSWNLPVTVSAADFVTLDFTANTGARKADGSLPDSNFLRLVSGSDLIDKGTNVGIAYTSAPDLGAYEYVNSAVALQPPSNLLVQ